MLGQVLLSLWYNLNMELQEIYSERVYNYSGGSRSLNPKISLEVFPPKNNDISVLFEELRFLKKYNPVLVSLTYGANGTSNKFSIDILRTIIGLEYNLMPHFTCMSSTKEEIERHLIAIENLGIENILALRGDKPENNNDLLKNDFKYANELVEYIHHKTTLSIGVAGYPEGHIESASIDDDIENLKKKVDAGASAIFTQLFFENEKFYRYIDLVRNSGITIPVIPGIMPIRNLRQIDKMIAMANAAIPKNLRDQLEKFPDDTKKIGIEFAISQCQNLIEQEVIGLHFFTLNHSDMVSEILDNILI